MEHDLAYLQAPGAVPSRAFNVVFGSLAQARRRPQLLAGARQVVVGDKDVTRLLKEGDPRAAIDQLERSGYCKPAPLEKALSQLTSDDLALVFEGGKARPLSRQLETVGLLQRYGSNVQVRSRHETALVAAKGLTRLVFDKARNAAVRMFPLHGNTEVEVNGVKHILDFGQDCVRVDSADHGGKIELEAELPVLLLVEGGCDGECEK